MIKNERQYRITNAQAKSFKEALDTLARTPKKERAAEPLRFQIQEDALREQLQDLRRELTEYEALRANPGVLEVSSLEELPRALIQARIASGLSHSELAERLGIKAQQIQRYEATDYVGVSLDRLNEVAKALGLAVRNRIYLPTRRNSLGAILKKLELAGVGRRLLEERLLPRDVVAAVRESLSTGTGTAQLVDSLTHYIGRVFNWPSEWFHSDAPLTLDNGILTTVQYKRTDAQAQVASPNAYTIYAHYIALLVMQCHSRSSVTRPPSDPLEVHQAIVASNGAVELEALLDFVWGCGIPVVPLRDPGKFHGACWRFDATHVIVVKQKTNAAARWIIDILHEYFHVVEATDADSIVEEREVMAEPARSGAEQRATERALQAALGGREEELAEACVQAAAGKVERLKAAVPRVASDQNVHVGLLANYLAYRLSFQQINWWPTAQNLQHHGEDPCATAIAHLRDRIDLARLAPLDRELLERAFS